MFDEKNVRPTIAMIWIVAFLLLILIFYFSLQSFKKNTVDEIKQLEDNIVKENWAEAKINQENIKVMWNRYKIIVLINNIISDVSQFDQKLKELEIMVHYQEDDAIDYIGSLKNSLDSITSLFPTP